VSVDHTIRQAQLDAQSGRIGRAIDSLRLALRLHPNQPQATRVLAMLLVQAGRFAEAEHLLRRMVQLAPKSPDHRNNLANVLTSAGKHADAITQWREALALDPNFLPAHFGLATAFVELGQASDAVAAAERGLALEPGSRELAFAQVTALEAACRIDDAEAVVERLVTAHPRDPLLEARRLTLLNYLPAADERLDAALAAYGRCFPTPTSTPPTDPDPERPLRIGFLSGDLRTHSVGFFAQALMLEIPPGTRRVAFATTATDERDPLTCLFRSRFDEWVEAQPLDDAGLDRAIRERKIDVLVELAGHFGGNRLSALVRKPAPIVVTAIGYPASTGHPAVDARLVDSITDPPGSEAHCTERLVRLDPCFLCYAPPTDASEPELPPPDAPITFGSFNIATKISADTIELWAATLAAVPEARLLVKSRGLEDAGARERLASRFTAAGVAGERLELVGPRSGIADHLKLYGRIHVALDTTPYSGTTTTCEALWMGVPVVTLSGDRHRSRVSASVLGAGGFPELIARDRADFVRLARDLARDRTRLADFRLAARDRMRSSPLLDAPAYARRFHAALRDLWRERCRTVR